MKPVFADILMLLHFLWAAFMVIGLPLGLWLRSPTLRWVHFGGMTLTAFFAAAGMYCPLTVWEETLRWGTDRSFSFEGGFLVHHLSSILYPQIEPWFLRSVSVFWGALTVLSMVVIKPGKKK
jgi:hypothetical protein